MAEKTYSQMKEDFKEFYFKVVKPYIPEYETVKKQEIKIFRLFNLIWFTFLTAFLSFFLAAFTAMNSEYFGKYTLLFVISGIIFILIFVVSFIYILKLTKNNPVNEKGEIEIQYDFDAVIKEKLMNPFLKIFSEYGRWQSGLPGNYKELTQCLRESNIFNYFPLAFFDDVFKINYKNVDINIYDVNTSVFKNKFFGFLSAFAIVGFICASLFLYIIPAIILIFLIFKNINNIIRYAGFKGVVVEFNMNKSFKGHTFFLENSVSAKKIPFNHKKYESINTESTEFMKKYKVYSDDQIEARYVLTTAMIERLENLSFIFNVNSLRGSFKDNKLILAINTNKDMFEMGSDFKETNFQILETLFKEVISVLEIVDRLKLDENTGL